MAFHPLLHEPFESLRFGRVLLVEIAPPPPPERPCRYCDVLAAGAPSRTHFSVPDAAARVILSEIERGASVDAVVFGGAGEPLRHAGIGTILRKIRTASHLSTVVLTNGVLLGDREVRRDAAEAETVVAWLPALRDRSSTVEPAARADAWERHVEGIASLRRESRVRIALEMPVRPGVNDGEESRHAWRRAAERVRPERVFVVLDPRAEEEAPEALEAIRVAIHPRAGAYLPDGTIVDQRCLCGERAPRS